MNKLTLLTKENCFRCNFVEKWLISRGIPFELKNLENVSEEQLNLFRDGGFITAPILIFDGKTAAGADMGFLEKVEKSLK